MTADEQESIWRPFCERSLRPLRREDAADPGTPVQYTDCGWGERHACEIIPPGQPTVWIHPGDTLQVTMPDDRP